MGAAGQPAALQRARVAGIPSTGRAQPVPTDQLQPRRWVAPRLSELHDGRARVGSATQVTFEDDRELICPGWPSRRLTSPRTRNVSRDGRRYDDNSSAVPIASGKC